VAPSRRSAGPAAPTARTIVFGHANGFPAGTYRVLFEAWRAAGWSVDAVEAFGHDPRFPVTGNWPHLREQLAERVHAHHGRCVLVGHSLGGYLSLMVACHHPQAVAGVVMIDSPVVGGWRAHGVQVAKRTGLWKRVSPGRFSQRRRQHRSDREAARAHFAGKAAFATWDTRVLDDYLGCGLVDDEHGVRLRFRREVETRIYNTLPHHLTQLAQRHPPQAPVAFIGGTQSAEVRQVGLAATRAIARGRISWLEGSHLLPMQHPEATAAEVLRWIAAFGL
jgi:pimeloyl-ACP methyl ester carboxylesterase